jgi:hypothetical protein
VRAYIDRVGRDCAREGPPAETSRAAVRGYWACIESHQDREGWALLWTSGEWEPLLFVPNEAVEALGVREAERVCSQRTRTPDAVACMQERGWVRLE